MVERGRGLRLLDEAGLGGRITRQVAGQKFQGERSPQAAVEGVVDDPHPAFANERDELVRPDPRAWLERPATVYGSGSSSNFTRV